MTHLLLSLLLFFSVSAPPVEEYILEFAKQHLPQSGILEEGPDGFVYLKVDNGYINRLFPKLAYSGYSKPAYFRHHHSPGAHISVFYVDERNKTGPIAELGQRYAFKMTGIAAFPPKTKEYIVLEVEAPELEQLRTKYGLSPFLQGHAFHITIAKKIKRSL